MFKLFSEHLASVLREHTALEIVIHKNKAYPAPSFYDQLFDGNSLKEQQNNSDSVNKAHQSFAEGAKKFEDSGDLESAISFYESALAYKKDRLTASKLIQLYDKTNQNDKAKELREQSSSWS